MSHEVQETDEEFDARYVAFFSRPDIDGWEIRKVRLVDGGGMQL
jgi:cytochrome c oxidase subunit 5a